MSVLAAVRTPAITRSGRKNYAGCRKTMALLSPRARAPHGKACSGSGGDSWQKLDPGAQHDLPVRDGLARPGAVVVPNPVRPCPGRVRSVDKLVELRRHPHAALADELRAGTGAVQAALEAAG